MKKNLENRIIELLIKRLNIELNDTEENELQQWIGLSEENRLAVDDFLQDNKLKEGIKNLYQSRENIWQRLDEQIPDQKIIPLYKKSIFRYAAAAVIFILLSGVSYYFLKQSSTNDLSKSTAQQRFKNDVLPGKNKAELTLADGSKVVLDSASSGKLAQQGNTLILNENGQLVYDEKNGTNQEMLYNTLSTARGEIYSLVLADGSKVWLNSASSIRFPVAFIGDERKVEITGEAYFEVVNHTAKPFKVISKGIEVKDLGTHFNVNAYDDEACVKATLLEGSVIVTKDNATTTLVPGQQAEVKEDGKIAINRKVDVDEVMAWKNELFSFKGAEIKSVMRQISRWYDVDIVYEKMSTEKFHVEMSRNTKLSNVFKILETTGGVHFKIDGKKVTVLP